MRDLRLLRYLINSFHFNVVNGGMNHDMYTCMASVLDFISLQMYTFLTNQNKNKYLQNKIWQLLRYFIFNVNIDVCRSINRKCLDEWVLFKIVIIKIRYDWTFPNKINSFHLYVQRILIGIGEGIICFASRSSLNVNLWFANYVWFT